MNARMDAAIFVGRCIHFVGIGGCGMSGLALMMQARGARVTGSDASASETTRTLIAGGIEVIIGTSLQSITEAVDSVVYSAAISNDHPELVHARSLSIETVTYAHALGAAQAGRTAVAIAGTHGKSTTTALLAHLLIESGLDPSVIVGATCPQLNGGTRTGAETIPKGPLAGSPGIFVAEACEFNRSFHSHQPMIALINNVEEDHLDVYGSLDEIVKAFREFAGKLPTETVGEGQVGGRLLIAHEGAHRRAVASGLRCAVSTFGWSPTADYRVEYDPATNATQVWHRDECLVAWLGTLAGEHNALNAAAAAILATWLGADSKSITRALENFAGVDRRMQFLGACSTRTGARVRVFDDYGHHPTECEKTLTALRLAENPRRIICVFQPHQHSRTRFLLEQFAQSFSHADMVIVPPIYFVRDSEIERTLVSSNDLVERLNARGVHARAMDDFDAISEFLHQTSQEGDLIVVMGAGPVWQIGHDFVKQAGNSVTAAAASMPPRAAASPGE
ncbi:MAG: UDP-N-acetylmuramate--L-alanine ligase [Phycisphaerales bacterium]|nr:UDP-N-acetylmuramate--L-alanine ligase [Phycisphaerales bacterium]